MLLFLVDLINIEIFRISFSFFYSFSFILRSRATSKRKLHGMASESSNDQVMKGINFEEIIKETKKMRRNPSK